ncbi:MAG: asparagine synthase-related protein [Candidatus Hydrogenedentota bacterium]
MSAEVMNVLDDFFKARRDVPCRLAFSGGTDSTMLALAAGTSCRLFVLATDRGGRDLAGCRRTAELMGLACDAVVVTLPDIIVLIESHREILSGLQDYTQRILAVCELFLCREAFRTGSKLVAGHGPEAIFGGFRRRAAPSLDELDEISRESNVNAARLRIVARESGCEILLPFFESDVWNSLLDARRKGLDRVGMVRGRLPDYQPLQQKAALQNGSGIHYLFAREARRRKFSYVRDFMEELIR